MSVNLPSSFPCEIPGCKKVYYNSSHLRRHQQCHDRPKPYRCPVPECDHAYAKKSQLKQHQAVVHGGKALYTCGESVTQGGPLNLGP